MGALDLESLIGTRSGLARKAGRQTRVEQSAPTYWIETVRRGLPARALDAVAKAVELTQSELSATLAIPQRTLIRRKKQGTLSTDESAKLLRVARILQRATAVFEDHASALHWLKSPNRSLGGVTPLSLLDTDLGAEAVTETLGRIEHGVFA